MSRWIEIKATFAQPPADWAPAIEVFREEGIEGTVQTDRPPTLCGYIADDPENRDRAERLKSTLVETGAIAVEATTIQEVNWAEAWKQFFKPRRVGRRFVVRPSWEFYEAESGDLEIVLDPGQAFGTGDHPTTRLMLELIEDRVQPGHRVADIGCGSGILSVAALRMGASNVVAVDVDSVAVRSTLDNADRNGVEIQAQVGTGFTGLPEAEPYDLVLSNIISAALIRMAPDVPAHLKPGGDWIVSGIIEQNWPDVLAAAERTGFRLERKEQEGDWVAAVLSR